MHLKLTIEYDGTNYCGWQLQNHGPTIQGVLGRSVCSSPGRISTPAGSGQNGCGRTCFRAGSMCACEQTLLPTRPGLWAHGSAAACREPHADLVEEKDMANYCEYFSFNAEVKEQERAQLNARAQLEALFKKKK